MAMKLIRTLALPALLAVPSFIAVPALAADLPYKAPPPVAAPYSWSGFYLGANVGMGWGKADVSASGVPISSTIDLDGLSDDAQEGLAEIIDNGTSSFSRGNKLRGMIGGAQFGFNVQSGAFVFGLEADFQGSLQRHKNGNSSEFGEPFQIGAFGTRFGDFGVRGDLAGAQNTSYRTGVDWFGTVRGRIGVANDNFLVYATGGLAYGRVRIDGTTRTDGGIDGVICLFVCAIPFDIPFDPSASSFSGSKTNYGWTLGGGVEWAWTDRITFKAEYLYMDLGSLDVTGTSPTGDDYTLHAKFTNQIARVGFNYKLGSPY